MVENEYFSGIMDNFESIKNENGKNYLNFIKWVYRLTLHTLEESTYKNKKKKSWAFSRGSVIKVDFGYNVGYELGGVHYAIVMNKKDSIYSGTLNVIPLSSKKENKKIHKNEVDIGDEFYEHIQHKIEATDRDLHMFNLYQDKIETELNLFYDEHTHNSCAISDLQSDKYGILLSILLPGIELKKGSGSNVSHEILTNIYKDYEAFYLKTAKSNQRLREEISFMKQGTVAKVDQFTTVSKKRIVDPTKSFHALSKVSLFENTIDLLNEKVKELFVFDK